MTTNNEALKALDALNNWIRDGERFSMPRGELTKAEEELCENADFIRTALLQSSKVDLLMEALIDAKNELWDEWHPSMSREQWDNHWLIKQINEALTQFHTTEKK